MDSDSHSSSPSINCMARCSQSRANKAKCRDEKRDESTQPLLVFAHFQSSSPFFPLTSPLFTSDIAMPPKLKKPRISDSSPDPDQSSSPQSSSASPSSSSPSSSSSASLSSSSSSITRPYITITSRNLQLYDETRRNVRAAFEKLKKSSTQMRDRKLAEHFFVMLKKIEPVKEGAKLELIVVLHQALQFNMGLNAKGDICRTFLMLMTAVVAAGFNIDRVEVMDVSAVIAATGEYNAAHPDEIPFVTPHMDFLKILTGYRRDENSSQFLVNTNVIVSVCGVPAKTVFTTYLPSFPPDTLRLGTHPSCRRLSIMDMVEELGEKCEDGWRVESWYQTNKERVAQYQAQYYQDNKEEIAQYKAEYYQDNKKEIAQYYQDNKVEFARYNAQYYQDNKGEKAEYNAQYRQDNKEEIAEYSAQYYQDNKEEIAMTAAQYRESHRVELRIASFVNNKLTCIRELCDGVEKEEFIQKRTEIHRKRKQLFDSGMGEAGVKDELLDDVMNLQKEVKGVLEEQEANQ